MRTLSFLAVITLLFSCQQGKNHQAAGTDTTAAAASDSLSFNINSYSEKTQLACKTCPETNLKIVKAQGNSALATIVNDSIFSAVKRAVVPYNTADHSQKTYQQLLQTFIAEYDKQKKSFPDAEAGWAAIVKTSVNFQNEKLLNVLVDSYVMTGGAHGQGILQSLIFDKQTASFVPAGTLIVDQAGFATLAEKKFRETFKIAEGSSINSTGLMFDGDKFYVSEDLIIKKEGVVVHYNSDTIAAHAEGAKDVLISWKEAQPFLNKKLL